jgi:hypothetical protein
MEKQLSLQNCQSQTRKSKLQIQRFRMPLKVKLKRKPGSLKQKPLQKLQKR